MLLRICSSSLSNAKRKVCLTPHPSPVLKKEPFTDLICKDCAEPKQIERDYATWERDCIQRENALLARDLAEKPEDYVVSMNM